MNVVQCIALYNTAPLIFLAADSPSSYRISLHDCQSHEVELSTRKPIGNVFFKYLNIEE